MKARDDGFSLVETAIVIFLLGILSASLFGLINSVVNTSARSASRSEAREYLSSFADGFRAVGWPTAWGSSCPPGPAANFLQVNVVGALATRIPTPPRLLPPVVVAHVEFAESGADPAWNAACNDGSSELMRVVLTVRTVQTTSDLSAVETSMSTIVMRP